MLYINYKFAETRNMYNIWYNNAHCTIWNESVLKKYSIWYCFCLQSQCSGLPSSSTEVRDATDENTVRLRPGEELWYAQLRKIYRDVFGNLQCRCFAEPRNQAVAGVWRLLLWCTGSCDRDVEMVVLGWDGCDSWMRWRLARCIMKWHGV